MSCQAPGTVLKHFTHINTFNPYNNSSEGACYYFHFIDKETEAQRDKSFFLSHL